MGDQGGRYPDLARHGWSSDFPTFREAGVHEVRGSLHRFLGGSSPEQAAAWDESIQPLQREVGEVLDRDHLAARYTAILEYELPLELRRADVVLLMSEPILVLELKGKALADQADLDQAAAYARDLRAYHRECERRSVHPIVVLMRSTGRHATRTAVQVIGADAIDGLAAELDVPGVEGPVDLGRFLSAEAYRPLPTIVEAARELFERRELRRIWRAHAATQPAVEAITRIIHEAAGTSTRRLVLLTGIPGAGKTLVGLQVVHARFLDDLAVARTGGRPTAPAVYLSGNGPLVEVLQYELRSANGVGKAFVRGVKPYVETYSRARAAVPPEHVLIFDEAQRAFDADQVDRKHPGSGGGRSEPEHFVEFAERVPGWCVVVALVGTGKEIHEGEEGGIVQWRWAVERSVGAEGWQVHGPPGVAETFRGYPAFRLEPDLHLSTEVRFHLAHEVHDFAAGLVEGAAAAALRPIAERLETRGYHLRVTRDLELAKAYLWRRYDNDPDARFGIVASSRDRDLPGFGIFNDWNSTKVVRYGPWFAEGQGDYEGRSCRNLRQCVTEFGCQGLELDAVLLAWGTDFVRQSGTWSNARARRYRPGNLVRDAFRLRMNAYRVLLTRARDAIVALVPPLPLLDETYAHLVDSGFRVLEPLIDPPG